MKKSTLKMILTATLAIALGVMSAGGALAANYYPVEVTTLTQYLNSSGASYTGYTGTLSGSYYVTPVAYEALDTIQFKASATDVLFTNKNMATEFGQVKQVANIGTASFNDLTTGVSTSVTSSGVQVLQLTKDWTLSQGLTLTAGTLILGLNDKGSADCDKDDFILAVSKSAPTPVPAAVWLLGSGLLGALGFKRTRKTEQA